MLDFAKYVDVLSGIAKDTDRNAAISEAFAANYAAALAKGIGANGALSVDDAVNICADLNHFHPGGRSQALMSQYVAAGKRLLDRFIREGVCHVRSGRVLLGRDPNPVAPITVGTKVSFPWRAIVKTGVVARVLRSNLEIVVAGEDVLYRCSPDLVKVVT